MSKYVLDTVVGHGYFKKNEESEKHSLIMPPDLENAQYKPARQIEDAVMGFAMVECLRAWWVMHIVFMHNTRFHAWLCSYAKTCRVNGLIYVVCYVGGNDGMLSFCFDAAWPKP